MMALVLLGVLFLWLSQVFLFERNYIAASIAETQGRIEPMMDELKGADLALDSGAIEMVSMATGGKIMLVDGAGALIAMYSYGHPIELADSERYIWDTVKNSAEYEQLLNGETYSKEVRYGSRAVAYEIGIPVTYDGQRAYAILSRSLDELQTVLSINRTQLVYLCVFLTVMAAVLAALLARRFVKPIYVIKDAVDGLAKGDLDAKPNLNRRDELGQLAGSVEELGVALKRVDVLRREVIANVSHELRAPLALIAGYAEMVRDVTWKDDERREQDLGLIIRESGRMSEMVSDIMESSQLQSGFLQLKKDCYNLVEIAESEIAHCEGGAKEHNIQIAFEQTSEDMPAAVDALKISQVMRNLLYNAINHTKDNETVTVRLTGQNKAIRFSVVNPGEPIPVEEREIIWERYQRGQHHGGRRQGTGIGLSIVSTILKAHGFPYGVDCADGLTVFWFECPYCH
jgi:signal transduction histidine kinase